MTSPVIRNLDDNIARKILGIVARSRREATGQIVAWDPALSRRLPMSFSSAGSLAQFPTEN
jgi:hypothetical protein